MRDEMANLAWAIERSIESPVEERGATHCASTPQASLPDGGPGRSATAACALSVGVDRCRRTGSRCCRCSSKRRRTRTDRLAAEARRGAAARRLAAGAPRARRAAEPRRDLLLYDEEVPREGVRVTRHTSWRAGSTARPGCGWRIANRSGAAKGRAGCSSTAFERPRRPDSTTMATAVFVGSATAAALTVTTEAGTAFGAHYSPHCGRTYTCSKCAVNPGESDCSMSSAPRAAWSRFRRSWRRSPWRFCWKMAGRFSFVRSGWAGHGGRSTSSSSAP